MRNIERPVFDSLANATGIVDVFMERKEKYMPALSMAQEILREPSHLNSVDREIIAAYTSRLNNCEYCCGSHTEFAKSLGANEQDLQNIMEENYDSFRLEPLLKYVKKLTLTPGEISSQDKDLVIAAGFSEEELKDAVMVCAIFNFYNRIVEGHGIDKNENTWIPSAEMINKHGYDKRYS